MPAPPQRPRDPGLRAIAVAARPFALFGAFLALSSGADAALAKPAGANLTAPERVDARFTRCGYGRGWACVIDGDTIKLGKRKIRIVGIDAPEVHARCQRERVLAGRATARLQQILNQGPFEMKGRPDDMKDRYGRDLRTLTRRRPDGSVQSIADDMRASGLARRYVGFKRSWC